MNPLRTYKGDFASDLIQDRCQKDRFDNDVSIITIPGLAENQSPRTFRMVHHRPIAAARQKATIYAKRGLFVRWTSFSPSNDCIPTTASIAGYEMAWGDGDVLGPVTCPPNLPDLRETLGGHSEDDFDGFLVTVLAHIADIPEAWEFKS